MRKKMKKFFAVLILSTVLTVGASAISTLAEESGQCGENATWVIDNEGVLTISGAGEMEDFASIYSVPWYDYKDNIKECVIEEGITNVGSYAFNGFSELESVSIPDSVTQIGNHVFSFCTTLTKVEIPDNVVSIGNSAFVSCTGLRDIIIPDKTTSVGYSAFYDCTGLESVTISESIVSIGNHAFSGCSGLKNVYINNLEAWCNVSLGNSTSTPLFYGENLYVDNAVVTELHLPEGITEIKDFVFYSMENLESVTIPDSVLKIGSAAFSDCGKLLDVYYKGERDKWDCVDIENSSIDYARIHCTDDVKCFSPESDFQFSSGAITKYTGSAHVVDIPATIGGEAVQSIAANAFERTSVSVVTVPDSVTAIGSRAFQECRELRSISLPKNITAISNYAFSNCKGLWEIVLPDNIVNIGNSAFANCTNLESITIPHGITKIGYSAFSSCSNLNTVYYGGSEEEWNEINIDSTGNTYLTNANIIYKAEELTNFDYTINSITLREVSTNSKLETIPENSFVAEINVTNVSSEKTNVVIIVAYDENGGMLDMDFVYADSGTGGSITFGSLISNSKGEVHSVKVFVRPAINSLVPLAESKEISK